MSFKLTLFAGLGALMLSTPALAGNIMVHDGYARAASPIAKSGAAFLVLHNHGDTDDRLIGVSSPAAQRVELHTHIEDAGGVMKMIHVQEGFPLPAGEMIEMKRGGKHVMFMGLNDPFEQGEEIPLTLIFEQAGDVKVNVPVDLERKPMTSEGHDHDHDHSHDMSE